MYLLWPFSVLLLLASADNLSPAPAITKLGRAKQPAPTEFPPRRGDVWSQFAISRLINEKNSHEITPLIPLTYEGSISTDIIFKDDSSLPGGPYFRTLWPLFHFYIKNGFVRRDTHLFDYTFDGSSGITVAHFARVCQLKITVFVNIDAPIAKIDQLVSLGATVKREQIHLLEFATRREAARTRNGFFFNTAGALAQMNPPEELELNIYQEVAQQLKKDENITRIDYFIAAASTGALLRSISLAASLNSFSTKIVAVDSEFSSIYDSIVNNRFQSTSGSVLWRFPGIPGVGGGVTGPLVLAKNLNLRRDMLDEIIKLSDLAIIAAMHVLHSKGISAGPSTAANFLASLVIATTESSQSQFTTILTVMEDSSSFYQDTYLNENWVKQKFGRHGALWGFDCWKKVILEIIATGWNPLETAMDRGCPTGFQ